MACPFFMPIEKVESGGWIHPSRLPLGAGWSGRCCAPGHENVEPSDEEVREFCNLGYATNCTRLPQERQSDSVRFSVAHDRSSQIALWFTLERAHKPAGHGKLEYDLSLEKWISTNSDPRIQKMAECYLQSYLLRRIPPATTGV